MAPIVAEVSDKLGAADCAVVNLLKPSLGGKDLYKSTPPLNLIGKLNRRFPRGTALPRYRHLIGHSNLEVIYER